jgi:hypothetical protein
MLQTARENSTGEPAEAAQQPELEAIEPIAKAAPRSRPVVRNGRGRPATGKRSDPAFESTTVFLRRDTKNAAARLLVGEKGQDLSEVLEKLLSGWVRRQQP